MSAKKRVVFPEPDFGAFWPYDPAPDGTPPQIADRYGLFIGGRMTAPKSRRYAGSFSPRDESLLCEVAQAGAADVDAAYAAAAAALPGWAGLAGLERGKLLFRVARLLQDRAGEFAAAETHDSGLPVRESAGLTVPMAAAVFFHHAGWADKLRWLVPGARAAPLGLVGMVLSHDLPMLHLALNLAPALAAGNTVILKPARETPVTALKLASILEDAGIPPGVVNIVTGDEKTAALVSGHPQAAAIVFNGPRETCGMIRRAAAGSDRRLILRPDGVGTQIICEDAPLDQAVEGVIDGVFRGQRHSRWAGSRLLVQEPVATTLLAMLRRRLATLRTGDPLDRNTDLGPLPCARLRDHALREIALCAEEGPALHQTPCDFPAKGWFVPPTVFSGVALSHRAARGEIPGPALALMTFRTPREAVEKANNTSAARAAAVWSDKGSRALQIAAALKAGTVWINSYRKFDPASSFGDGREHAAEGGAAGLMEFVSLR